MKKKKPRKGDGPRLRRIMGIRCLEEIVQRAPEHIVEVYTSKPVDEWNKGVLALVSQKNIPIRKADKQKLYSLANSDSHQGVVACVREKEGESLNSLIERLASTSRALVLMLDGITDPHNLGALLRSAECFGVSAVVWSKNRGAPVTPSVAKVSVGASELVPQVKVSNLVESMKRFQDAGFEVVAAELGAQSESLNICTFPEKTVLVLGSEGKGVRELVKKQVDHHWYIPMAGQIDSLNVSQACAVFLYEWSRQRPR